MFVTIEDETGGVQLILWPKVFARYRRVLGNQVIMAKGGGGGDGIPLGRHRQRGRVERGANRRESLDARRPRLALSGRSATGNDVKQFLPDNPATKAVSLMRQHEGLGCISS